MYYVPELMIEFMDIYLHFSTSYYLTTEGKLFCVSDFWKREDFGDPENQRLRNRGVFRVKFGEKGGIFSTWRTLIGLTNSLRVGVPGHSYVACLQETHPACHVTFFFLFDPVLYFPLSILMSLPF